MDPLFKVVKGCDLKTKNIVNGYIREIQKIFPWQDNSYFIIPSLINHVCLSFYWIGFEFNKTYIGKNLIFINDTTIAKVKQNGYSVCAIGECVSRDICKTFQIEYCLKKYKLDFCPYIGYFKTNLIEDSSSFGCAPGVSSRTSVGIAISDTNKTFLSKYPSSKSAPYGKDRFDIPGTLKTGDRFMLEFDFIKSVCYIYYNDQKLKDVINLESWYIIPLVSLYYKGEEIEITKYHMH